jgi:hypothetical protein
VSLASLTAVEAGGCSKRSESLRSATRAGLPLVAQATGSISGETAYSLADYGVNPLPGLTHLCGHYELGPKGELITQDLFTGSMSPFLLEKALGRADKTRDPARPVSLRVNEFKKDALPKSCKQLARTDAQSLLVASRVL